MYHYAFQTHPGVRRRLEGKQRTYLSSRVATGISWSPLSGLKGEDGGVSGVSSSCGARGGFLPRHDEDLREPLVRRQGSQVSMWVARGSALLLSSYGRGI